MSANREQAIESLRRHRDRLKAERPVSAGGNLMRLAAIAELDLNIRHLEQAAA